MGFWREIRKEFHVSKFGFSGVQIDLFCHFQWRLPVGLYLAYRVLLMVYGVFWLGYIATYHGSPPLAWGAYLTNWSYTMLNIYLISHCLLALGLHFTQFISSRHAGRRGGYCCRKPGLESYDAMFTEFGSSEDNYDMIPDSASEGGGNGAGNGDVVSETAEVGYRHRHSVPFYVSIVWVQYNTISAAALMVTIVFFAFLFPLLSDYPNIGLENLQVHLINSVIILLEHAMSAVPYRLLHIIYPLLYGVIYMVFSVVYWAGDHDRVMYPNILDWNKPATTVGYVLLIGFVFIPLLHTFFFGLYKMKMLILRRFHFGEC